MCVKWDSIDKVCHFRHKYMWSSTDEQDILIRSAFFIRTVLNGDDIRFHMKIGSHIFCSPVIYHKTDIQNHQTLVYQIFRLKWLHFLAFSFDHTSNINFILILLKPSWIHQPIGCAHNRFVFVPQLIYF